MSYTWDFSVIIKYLPALIRGLIITLKLFFLSVIIGSIAGVIMGFAAKIRIKSVRIMLKIFFDIVRSLPPLILLLWLYYLIPIITGIKNISAFVTAVIAFSLNLAVFIADIIRGSLDNINSKHTDAAYALGMKKASVIQHIVLPELFRIILPSATSLYIHILKMTSIASVIAVHEMTHTANTITLTTYKSLELFTFIGIVYIIIIFPLSAISGRLEKKSDLGVNHDG